MSVFDLIYDGQDVEGFVGAGDSRRDNVAQRRFYGVEIGGLQVFRNPQIKIMRESLG